MGESSDKKIQSEIDKYKARGWRICKCGFGWGIVGLILFVIGIIFLAYFGKYWGDKDHWEKGLAYAGVVLLLVGLLVLTIGIFFCVLLYCIYRRINGPQRSAYKAPTFPAGQAPYPQQPPYEPLAADAENPQQPAPGAQPQDIHVEVQDRTHF